MTNCRIGINIKVTQRGVTQENVPVVNLYEISKTMFRDISRLCRKYIDDYLEIHTRGTTDDDRLSRIPHYSECWNVNEAPTGDTSSIIRIRNTQGFHTVYGHPRPTGRNPGEMVSVPYTAGGVVHYLFKGNMNVGGRIYPTQNTQFPAKALKFRIGGEWKYSKYVRPSAPNAKFIDKFYKTIRMAVRDAVSAYKNGERAD